MFPDAILYFKLWLNGGENRPTVNIIFEVMNFL